MCGEEKGGYVLTAFPYLVFHYCDIIVWLCIMYIQYLSQEFNFSVVKLSYHKSSVVSSHTNLYLFDGGSHVGMCNVMSQSLCGKFPNSLYCCLKTKTW